MMYMYSDSDSDSDDIYVSSETVSDNDVDGRYVSGNDPSFAYRVLKYAERIEMSDKNAALLIAEEEREKLHAEKKVSKKKRKKKRRGKKPATQSEFRDSGDSASEEEVPTSRSKENAEVKDEEEVLDPSCAFLNVVAKKKAVEIQQTHKKSKKKNANQLQIQFKRKIENGLRFIEEDQFEEAANIYTDIIQKFQKHPSAYAFYGNRSYCYERIGKYDLALKDAREALSINSKCAVNHYRKASALIGLRKYDDAENALIHVLKIDPDCNEARDYLIMLKKIRLLLDRERMAEYIAHLLRKNPSAIESMELSLKDIFISDDEDSMDFMSSTKGVNDPLEFDPSNPRKLKVLWLGNIGPDIDAAQIKALFSRFGTVELVTMGRTGLNENQYAFVNYKDCTSPGSAMLALQGHVLGSSTLLIKFPIKKLAGDMTTNFVDKTKLKITNPFPINGDECFFWRSSGYCYHNDNCRFKHIRAHKGIDQQRVTCH